MEKRKCFMTTFAVILAVLCICRLYSEEFQFARNLKPMMENIFRKQNTLEEGIDCPSTETQDAGNEEGGIDIYKTLWSTYTDLKNYWMYIFSLASKSNLLKNETNTISDGYVLIRNRVERLMDLSLPQRETKLKNLSDLIRQKIEILQNPPDCDEARVLLCHVINVCGFGCELHSLVNCLLQAFESERTLIYRSKNWHYAKIGWEYAFQPLSKCVDERDASLFPKPSKTTKNERVVALVPSHVENWIHWRIPSSLAPTLLKIHGHPYAWWLSQFTSYATRLQPWLDHIIGTTAKKINFTGNVAGMHVRRGDKIKKEAEKHEVEEYMLFIEQWFNSHERGEINQTRRVYLATEDPSVLPELQEKYPGYVFIGSHLVTSRVRSRSRYEEQGLEGVVTDIHFLSRCAFLTCTLSSSVCRTAYELLLTQHADASTRFQTVDTWYRFKRRFSGPWEVIMDHDASTADEMSARVGDEIMVSYNAHLPSSDGFLRGKNQRTKEKGKFPTFKAREELYLWNISILED